MRNQDYPGLFQSANKAAKDNQRLHFLCLKAFLIILFAGALLSLLPSENYRAAISAAVLFSLNIGLTLLMAFKRFDKSWYNARAVAESVKTRAWRYMMRTEPYSSDGAARELFSADLNSILMDNAEAIKVIPATNVAAITQEMDRVRSFPINEKKDFYKQYRVDEQLDWYVTQTKFNKLWNTVLFCLMIFFQAGALTCVIVKLNFPTIETIPTALFTTLAGVALSWMQSKKFGELSTSYNLTAHEISVISSKYIELSGEQLFTAFVRDAEAAFSREHTQWIARRGI